ncbi:MAG: metallopeptidase [Planctomycetota bacterium]|nr:metallopeptidase [Planctomycetota bacterium]
MRFALTVCALLTACATPPHHAFEEAPRSTHRCVDLVGWTVWVDPLMLPGGANAEVGARCLDMLANHLERLEVLLVEPQLGRMRDLELWVDWQHPELVSFQYHPELDWLERHGHDPRLHQKVHLPRAQDLLSRQQMVKHPAVILHELAHAYHDQVLGFDEPRIRAAYAAARERGDYAQVLDHRGRTVRHYALTDHKEYFAEATEAYFYRNDFFPFVRAELMQFDAAIHRILVEVWGPLP